jgi:4-hydroxybenzoate polyprenyltransferase
MAVTPQELMLKEQPPVQPDNRPREAPLLHRIRRRLEEYCLLARLDRPIGTWLLLAPALWALLIAGAGAPTPRVLVAFVLGAVVMRAAGCVINDFVDRDIDPYVRRTRDRPLAARRVTPHEALAVFVVLIGCALYLVSRLNTFTIELACVGAALTVSYPFLKRFFPMPQLYLGISFGGWAVPMAFAAQRNNLPRVAWVLYIAAIMWCAVYDTLYAMVDRDDDQKIGVRSSAVLFGDLDRLLIGVMQLTTVWALWMVGTSMHFGHWYRYGIIAVIFLFLYQQYLIRKREPAGAMAAFMNNQYVGLAILVGILMQYKYPD